MKKLRFNPYVCILAAVLSIYLLSGCECSISTARVSDARICESLNGNLCEKDNPVVSTSAEAIYASCNLKGAPAGTKVKFSWYYYGDTKFEIDNVILDTGDYSGKLELNSYLSRPDMGWPKGVYEVVIQIQTDNAKPLIKQFTVQ